jgi:hypothetical protein
MDDVKTFLLSYPRSGNTWVRYIVEALSKRPTKGYGNKMDEAIGFRINIGVDLNAKPILEKSHKLYNNKKDNKDKLIVIIRNYKEVLIRHASSEPGHESIEIKSKRKFNNDTKGIQDEVDYIEVIMSYDVWSGPKLLVYYDNLIDNPSVEINRIAEFLDINKKEALDFISKYDYHVNRGIKSYHEKSYTNGKNNKYHQNRVSKDLIDFMTLDLKKRHSVIFEKYLKRFEFA